MTANNQPFLLCPKDIDNDFYERIRESIKDANTKGFIQSTAIAELGLNNILSVAVSQNSAAFLLKNGGICRVGIEQKTVEAEERERASTQPVTSNSQGSAVNNSNASIARSNSAAKFRRVMLSTSTLRRGERGGVIIDSRARPLPAEQAVPEHLIAQAQVVLQGKSRDVIVRELRRTHLNVNEAVNNLLSRDDDEEDGEEGGGEVVLPEELLSLLDPLHGAIAEEQMYGSVDNFDYMMAREIRSRGKDARDKDKKKEDSDQKTRLELGNKIEYWNEKGFGTPQGVQKFVRMAATSSEILGVSSEGKLYGWRWSEAFGDTKPHYVSGQLMLKSESIVHLATCSLRIAITTNENRIITWLDENKCGERIRLATQCVSTPLEIKIDDLSVSNFLAVARVDNSFYWCGIYPFSERQKIWEKERNKSRKHVTFESNSEIVEGSEVRSKSCPLYAAGSVALYMSDSQPMVGVLMESAWTHSEMCRFRVVDPLAFDSDFPTLPTEQDGEKKTVFAHPGSRKRRATQEIFNTSTTSTAQREEAWPVGECIWVHEQQPQDTAIVKILDGAYIAVEYQRQQGDLTYASSLSASLNKDTPTTSPKMRLLRKDDMCLVSSKTASPRTPTVFQKEPAKFVASSSVRRVLSAVADSTGIRALVEKRNGRLHIVRISIKGHVLSDRPLPLHTPALFGPALEPPKLVNYGDDRILMLVDGNDCVLPLMRNALMGFREPVALHQPRNRHVALVTNNPISVKTQNQLSALIFILPGPSPRAVERGFPSLLQAVLHSDPTTVRKLLDEMLKIGDEDLCKQEIRDSRTDAGGNILHAAIRIAVASKNREDSDPGTRKNVPSKDEPTRSTGSGNSFMDPLEQKWQRMLRSRREDSMGGGLPIGGAGNMNVQVGQPARNAPVEVDMSAHELDPRVDLTAQAAAAAAAAAAAQASSGPMTRSKAHEQSANANHFSFMAPQQAHQVKDEYSTPVADVKERQKGAIEIVEMLVGHETLRPYLPSLLAHRDAHGCTPFVSAVNIRSYGAALHLWKAISTLTNNFTIDSSAYIHPHGGRVDDSPLFLLCYNDTCSFTWTGEEHINQDIYECRDCALVNSLCCCTECANTCHRNHDCRLKRTSPTAYCDCWEKCQCKAVILGNQDKREELLKQVLRCTRLHEQTNRKGEHILLFLARTVGRQTAEQGNYSRRRARCVPENSNMPEHDLEPPKFSNFALEQCITVWKVVKNLLTLGHRSLSLNEPVTEDLFHLHCQSGSTHLDKFVFTLLAKCPEKFTNILVDTIVGVLNEKSDSECVSVAARLVRSVIRLYVLSVLVSPIAAAAAIAGEAPAGHAPPSERRVHAAISLSGFLSLIKRDPNPSRESKSIAIANFVLRCRHVLRRLCAISCLEVAAAADAILAPVRLGIIKSNWAILMTPGQDALEVIERYLTYEPDMTTVLSMSDETRERKKRKSRRETERDEEGRRHGNGTAGGGDSSDGDSDSDGDELGSSRRHNSQSGNEALDSTGNTQQTAVRRKSGISTLVANRAVVRSEGSEEDEDRSISDSDDDEDDEHSRIVIEDDENVDDEEEDMEDDPLYDNSDGEGDHNVSMFEVANDNYDAGNSREGEEYMHSSPHYDDGEESNTGEEGSTFRDETAEDAEIRNITERREETRGESSETTNQAREQSGQAAVTNANESSSQSHNDNQNDSSQDSSRRRNSSRDRRSSESTLSWTLRRNASEENSQRRNETWRDALLASHDSGNSSANVGDSSSGGNSLENRNRGGEEAEEPSSRGQLGGGTDAAGTGFFGRKRVATEMHTGKSAQETTYQLSAGFSFLVRALSDLLNFLQAEDEDVDRPFKVYDAHQTAAILAGVSNRLAPSFAWMSTAMDRVEAQLRFGNAIMASGVAESRLKAEKRAVKRRDKKDKATEDLYQKRKETLEYLMGIMRSYSAEAGDDLPVVELENLRTLAFAFDAFLVFSNASDALSEQAAAASVFSGSAPRSSSTDDSLDSKAVHTFFRRSDSVSFPGTAACDAWDMLEGSGAQLPLIEHPDLLTADADRSVLFAPPQEQLSGARYKEIYKNLGVSDAGHQSFTEPMDTTEILRRVEEEESTENMQMMEQEEEEEGKDDKKEKKEEEYPVPEGMEPLSLEIVREEMKKSTNTKQHKVMSRWKNTLLLMAKECHEAILDSLGGETGNSPLLTTIATFAVRQAQFKKIIDKFRNSQMKDINLEVSRDPVQLIRDTVFQLNQTYVRRSNQPKSKDTDASSPLLASARVKVRFRDEPGEGTGVARSFYTALAEAFAQLKKLPFEELGWTGGDDYLYGGQSASGFSQQSPASQIPPTSSSGSLERTSSRSRIQIMRERSGAFGGRKKIKRHPLSVNAQPYTPRNVEEALKLDSLNVIKQERVAEEPARERPLICDAIYARVHAIRPTAAARITGILADVPVSVALQILTGSSDLFKQYLDDAVSVMLNQGLPSDLSLLSSSNESEQHQLNLSQPLPTSDDSPLFYRTSPRGFFSPVAGRLSPIRLNAFRNVGRVMGLCLSQGDLFPFKLARHVYKYILDRPVNWIDLAFFDHNLFNSLREMLLRSNDSEFYEAMQLYFVTNIVPAEDPSKPAEIAPLKPGGENIMVTRENVVEYVYRYTERRLLGEHLKCLQAMRQGVFDVMPVGSLAALYAEDLRLLLCGSEQLCVSTLQALTTFSDESHASNETLNKFKEWFWQVVDQLSPREKSDLLFFWTGTPSLPPVGEGWAPQPTVMIRPADDHFLPTANTCISRLYVPLYSSRKLLRAKLQLAIKAKNFGFV